MVADRRMSRRRYAGRLRLRGLGLSLTTLVRLLESFASASASRPVQILVSPRLLPLEGEHPRHVGNKAHDHFVRHSAGLARRARPLLPALIQGNSFYPSGSAHHS